MVMGIIVMIQSDWETKAEFIKMWFQVNGDGYHGDDALLPVNQMIFFSTQGYCVFSV